MYLGDVCCGTEVMSVCVYLGDVCCSCGTEGFRGDGLGRHQNTWLPIGSPVQLTRHTHALHNYPLKVANRYMNENK